jgi:4-hydroxybenzoate polyprenyltransferase
MLGPIVAFAYLQVGWRDVAPADALPRVLALLWAAVALAAYGYAVNDAADVEADRRVGKDNSMTHLAPGTRVGVVLALAVAGALPWLVVDLELPALVVLAGIYALPLAYSPRPLRLKEHRLLGPAADASNAFVLPSLFAVALFAPLGEAAGPPLLMVAGALAWAAGFGLRAILLHQVADASNDRASGTATFVTTIGEATAVRVMRRVLFPLELVGLALLTATVATWAPVLVVGGLVLLGAFHAARLADVLDRTLTVTTIERGWLLSWTQIWPALVLSLALAVRDPWNLALTAVVVVLFWPRLRAGLVHLRAVLANERLRHRRG